MALSFGPFTVQLYGLILGIAIVVAASLAAVRAQKSGYNPTIIWDALLWVIGGGLVGARLYHVIDAWNIYSHQPTTIFAVWNGGLAIYGGLIGGGISLVLVSWYYKHKRSADFQADASISRISLVLADLAAFGLPIGQAIGRLGNWVNQELFGPPTVLPWGIQIDALHRPLLYAHFERFHPLFLYELMWSLMTFTVLYLIDNRYQWPVGRGIYLSLYLILYGIGRFMLEPWRLESWNVQGVPVASIISLLAIALGMVWLIGLRRRDQI